MAGVFTTEEIDFFDDKAEKKIVVDRPDIALKWAKDIVGIEKESSDENDGQIQMTREKDTRIEDVANRMREIFKDSKEFSKAKKVEEVVEIVEINEEIYSEEDPEELEDVSEIEELEAPEEDARSLVDKLTESLQKENATLVKIEDWEPLLTIPRLADKKSIRIGFNYIKIKGETATPVLIKEEKPNKKFGRETADKMNAALKIMKEYKIKVSGCEFHYVGNVVAIHFDKKIKLKSWD